MLFSAFRCSVLDSEEEEEEEEEEEMEEAKLPERYVPCRGGYDGIDNYMLGAAERNNLKGVKRYVEERGANVNCGSSEYSVSIPTQDIVSAFECDDGLHVELPQL